MRAKYPNQLDYRGFVPLQDVQSRGATFTTGELLRILLDGIREFRDRVGNLALWSSGMIPRLGRGGPGFEPRQGPFDGSPR